jgi:hypothetical protein
MYASTARRLSFKRSQMFFPVTEFAGKEFLMPYGNFDLDVYKIH